MFDKVKECKIPHTIMMMKRLSSFLCIFDLRQGTIIIAVHQLALATFVLLVHLVGISHLGEMLSMLHSDMEDDAERRGLFEVSYGGKVSFREGDVISTNNQKQFAKAQHLASETVIVLYTSTVLTFIYGVCCIALLVGAVKYQRGFAIPWIVAASLASGFITAVLFYGAEYSCYISHLGGKRVYYMACVLFLLTSLYSIGTVCSFALEDSRCECIAADERGEQLLLLDHAAHSSLLSAKQLNKLSHSTTTHFV